MILVDAHEDLAWNMITFGRDYTRSAAATRRLEEGTTTPIHNGDTLLGWPDYQCGQVAVVFATLFAAPERARLGDWDPICYSDINQAHRLYQNQLDAYERLADDHPDKFRLVQVQNDLQEVLSEWDGDAAQGTTAVEENDAEPTAPDSGKPVGLVILMEGAEGVRDPGELEAWWARGVRLIGLAWNGTRFCGGTREPGPLTSDGYTLLEGMANLGFGLDLSHMDEEAVLQALDFYPGQIVASHSNALSLLKGSTSNRHLSDRVIQGILERDGMIGVVLFNTFLKHGWRRGAPRAEITLQDVFAQIDYICQMAGDALHVGIGSDFDGGLGLQSIPSGIDTIADLQKLPPLLAEKGYSSSDITAIMGENWLSRLRQILPESL